MRKVNFYSGPAILPLDVLKEASESILDYSRIGLSIVEISHRSKEFVEILEECKMIVKELLNLDEDQSVLFMQGGASLQFCMIPYNLLDTGDVAEYLETGVWAKKAIKEANIFGNVHIAASSSDRQFKYIPKQYQFTEGAKYFHLTSNNTIYGSQIKEFPYNCSIPLIADMSSDIFSRPVEGNKFDLIYAGAQKNLGPSGATLVIVREGILGKVKRKIPSMLDYSMHIKEHSLYNTPCTFAIYVSLLTLRWIKKSGGLSVLNSLNEKKAKLLYDEIDRNQFFSPVVDKEDRSLMNVTFTMNKPEFEEDFLNAAKGAGCIGIKGHRLVGGFRASIYNAMDIGGVQTLVDVMKDCENRWG